MNAQEALASRLVEIGTPEASLHVQQLLRILYNEDVLVVSHDPGGTSVMSIPGRPLAALIDIEPATTHLTDLE